MRNSFEGDGCGQGVRYLPAKKFQSGLLHLWRARMDYLRRVLRATHVFILFQCTALALAVAAQDGKKSCENMNYYGICDAKSRNIIYLNLIDHHFAAFAVILEILGIEVDVKNANALAALQKRDIKRAYYKQVMTCK